MIDPEARRRLVEAACRLRFFTVRELGANARAAEDVARSFVDGEPYFERQEDTSGVSVGGDPPWVPPPWEYRVRPGRLGDLLAERDRGAATSTAQEPGSPPMTIAPLLDLLDKALSALEQGVVEPERREREIGAVGLQLRIALLHIGRQSAAPDHAAEARRLTEFRGRLATIRGRGGARGRDLEDWLAAVLPRVPLACLEDWSWAGPDAAEEPWPAPVMADAIPEPDALMAILRLDDDDPSAPGRRAACLRLLLSPELRGGLTNLVTSAIDHALSSGNRGALATTALCAAALQADEVADRILSALTHPRLGQGFTPAQRRICILALTSLAAPWLGGRDTAGRACFYLYPTLLGDDLGPLVLAASLSAMTVDHGVLVRMFASCFRGGAPVAPHVVRNLAIQLHMAQHAPLIDGIHELLGRDDGVRFLRAISEPGVRALRFADVDHDEWPFTVRAVLPNGHGRLVGTDRPVPLPIADDEPVASTLRGLCGRPPGSFTTGLRNRQVRSGRSGQRPAATAGP